MGTWGSGIMDNDLAQDVKIAFEEATESTRSVGSAVAQVRDQYADLLDDPDDGPDLLLALAWLGVAHGLVPSWLRDQAAEVVRSGRSLARWEDSPDYAARAEEEQRLLAILEGRSRHPEAGKKERRVRVRVGDVFEIPLSDGRRGYGQYVFWDERMGPLIQAYNLVSDRTPPVAAILASGPRFPPIITSLQAAIKAGKWRIIGHADVKDLRYPTFRNGNPGPDGRVTFWYLYDGRQEKPVGKLPPGGENYEDLMVWPPDDVAERIETGRNPYTHLV